jgi:aldehyde:ferredoxin oxidoreductase
MPVYLVVDGDQVHFRDASALWGMRSAYTIGSVLRDRESGSGTRTILRIGRAGEQLVTYASVIAETYVTDDWGWAHMGSKKGAGDRRRARC